jgi:hypothetical protein
MALTGGSRNTWRGTLADVRAAAERNGRSAPAPSWAATLLARYLALAYATRRFLRRPNSVA